MVKSGPSLTVAICGLAVLLLVAVWMLPAPPRSRFITRLAAGQPQVVVAYGTSLTAMGSWVGQLDRALRATYPGLARVVNSGAGGRDSRWGLQELAPQVLAHQPDAVFIEFAINDANNVTAMPLAESADNLKAMIDGIRTARPQAEIVVMTMNPATGVDGARRPRLRDYVAQYRQVAAARGVMLVDQYRVWEQLLGASPAVFAQYVPDGIHPNRLGCERVVTPAIFSAIGLRALIR